MKILNVTVTDKVTIENKDDINSGSVNTVKCVFSLPESFNGLMSMATFKKDGNIYNKTIVDNECYVPHEVLEDKGYVYFGVYAYEQAEDGLVLRESPFLTGFTVEQGSYMGEGQESLIIEPSDFEMYMASMERVKEETKAEIQLIIDNFLDYKNTIESITVNGEKQKIVNRNVDITIPDVSNFVTKEYVDDIVGSINSELSTLTTVGGA